MHKKKKLENNKIILKNMLTYVEDIYIINTC